MTSLLPTPRQLLTSLIDCLSVSTCPALISPDKTSDKNAAAKQPPINPFKSLPATHRALLASLHVFFDPPLLLPALDLLDRGLVTRVIQVDRLAHDSEVMHTIGATAESPQAHLHFPSLTPNVEDKSTLPRKKNTIYQVRSSQQSKSRFSTSHSLMTGNTIYTVMLEAWNCSCAAFTYSTFPRTAPGFSDPSVVAEDCGETYVGTEGMHQDGEWEFGGLSFGGESSVPCCKHLLACLLGERWEGTLGMYVKVREVGREEMAGIGSES